MLYIESFDPEIKDRPHSLAHDKGIDLLRQGLKREYNIDLSDEEIIKGEKGKPFLKKRDISFNISHSKELAVCGINNSNIGVDCEVIRKLSPGVIKRCFSDNEAEYINSRQDKNKAFTLLWTLKESYSKYDGRGYSVGFDKTVFDLENNKPGFNCGCEFLVYIINSQYIITICIKSRNEKITVINKDMDITPGEIITIDPKEHI